MYQANKLKSTQIVVLATINLIALQVSAQMPSVKVPAQVPVSTPPAEETSILFYIVLGVLFTSLGGAIVWWLTSKKSQSQTVEEKHQKNKQANSKWESEAVDADKEMEWYRKNQKVIKGGKDKKYPGNLPKTSKVLAKKAIVQPTFDDLAEEMTMDKKTLHEKMKRFQFSQLPINSINELKPAKKYDLLPISNDSDLMSAVEQAQDEYEEDDQVRDLALRILAAFRMRNSVESLGQIALYDVSANLRSKAVTALTEFDHESVFENLLLACADPTREVRAAAARGLFRLSFDRGDSWARIIESNDEFRMRQAVRAASEAGLVERSFDRLVHEDVKIAYEAFVFTTLLIRSGETKLIFSTIENHSEDNVKLALLQVLSIIKSEDTLPNLFDLLDNQKLSEQVKIKTDEVIKSFDLVPA